MAKIIFGLVGPLASGKGAFKAYVEKKYGAKDCRFSSILRDVLTRIGVTIDRTNLQKVSTVLRANFGEDLLAKVIVNDARQIETDIVVIDGVRRFADIKFLKELEHFYLVAIEAEPKLRYERMITRNENVGDKDKTYEQFLLDNEAEADREIPEVMKQASFKIDNNGSWEEFYRQIDDLINKLSKE